VRTTCVVIVRPQLTLSSWSLTPRPDWRRCRPSGSRNSTQVGDHHDWVGQPTQLNSRRLSRSVSTNQSGLAGPWTSSMRPPKVNPVELSGVDEIQLRSIGPAVAGSRHMSMNMPRPRISSASSLCRPGPSSRMTWPRLTKIASSSGVHGSALRVLADTDNPCHLYTIWCLWLSGTAMNSRPSSAMVRTLPSYAVANRPQDTRLGACIRKS